MASKKTEKKAENKQETAQNNAEEGKVGTIYGVKEPGPGFRRVGVIKAGGGLNFAEAVKEERRKGMYVVLYGDGALLYQPTKKK